MWGGGGKAGSGRLPVLVIVVLACVMCFFSTIMVYRSSIVGEVRSCVFFDWRSGKLDLTCSDLIAVLQLFEIESNLG